MQSKLWRSCEHFHDAIVSGKTNLFVYSTKITAIDMNPKRFLKKNPPLKPPLMFFVYDSKNQKGFQTNLRGLQRIFADSITGQGTIRSRPNKLNLEHVWKANRDRGFWCRDPEIVRKDVPLEVGKWLVSGL